MLTGLMYKICQIESCKNNHKAKGLCNNHYEQRRRQNSSPCSLNDCKNKIFRRKLCSKHYGQKYIKKKCIVERCSIFTHSKDMCKKHYLRKYRHGDVSVCKIAEDGLGTINHNGYRVLYKPNHPSSTKNGTILEHRYIISNQLGRPLRDNENVHHINGVRDDNRLENLEIWVISQPSGQKPQDLVRWALEIIELYGKDVNYAQ